MKPTVNDSGPSQFSQILQHAYSTAPPPPNTFLTLLTVPDVDYWECLSKHDIDDQLLDLAGASEKKRKNTAEPTQDTGARSASVT